MSDPTPATDPTAYFESLADPTRIRILAVLARADAADETPLSYATLQSRVGVRDNGRLNYHLSRLDGRFLRRDDGEYTLLPAGRFAHLVAVQRSHASPSRVDTDADCPACGTRLVAERDDGSVAVVCPDCERTVFTADVPSVSSAATDRSATLAALDRAIRERNGFLSRGLCPWCRSLTETTVRTDDGVGFRHRCDCCASVYHTTPGELLLDHPEVVAFHRRRDVALSDRRAWTLPFVTDGDVAVRSRDPWRVAVTISLGGSDLTCVLDGSGRVVSTSRRTSLRGI